MNFSCPFDVMMHYILYLQSDIHLLVYNVLQSWDDDLASTAQRWADTCPSGHDKSYDRAEFGSKHTDILHLLKEFH
jgi:hypothetical protein